jgi:hypothetical protein
MKKMSRFVTFALAWTFPLIFAACNQTLEIKDGMIPEEFLPHVQKILGSYQGQVERRSTGLIASLEGNRLVLKSTDDIISPACQSQIGHLKKVTYKEEKDKTVTITEARFAFDPNLCGNDIIGRELHFVTAKKNPLTWDMTLLDHREWGWVCSGTIGHYPYPQPTYPGDRCWQETYNIFMTGRFVQN